jgi:acetoin utilization deacetylase AcuC-like enzyme
MALTWIGGKAVSSSPVGDPSLFDRDRFAPITCIVNVSRSEIITVSSNEHLLHSDQVEFLNRELVPSFESPSRIDLINRELFARKILVPWTAKRVELDLTLVHDHVYVATLGRICRSLSRTTEVLLPSVWPGSVAAVRKEHPYDIQLGALSRDMFTSVGAGTFTASVASVGCAVAAMEELLARGAGCAFALSRPPHHHAGRNYMNGYCYMNGTAIAALSARAQGLRVAVVDVDYHHGNGTQELLYQSDILFCSIHGDPAKTFPFYSGFSDERGHGLGEGFNLNVPMAHGTDGLSYAEALRHVLAGVCDHAPDLLVLSLGVDTFEGDPIGQFRLGGRDFIGIGEAIAKVGAPVLFIMEGGYAVAEIGKNVANVIEAASG